jgi:hypothetical protein
VDAGFLEREKRGTWAYYRIVPGSLAGVRSVIADVEAVGAPPASPVRANADA